MSFYKKSNQHLWTGRNEKISNGEPLYWHQAVECIDTSKLELPILNDKEKGIALLGYVCDEGVYRNRGRGGALEGPDAIRKMIAPQAYHLKDGVKVVDVGNICCTDGDMEEAQNQIAIHVDNFLQKSYFPILLGGGHDLAYGHYSGIKKFLDQAASSSTIGIVNLDAHFDLRTPLSRGNSGTPFSQIASDCQRDKTPFNYLCLGIQKAANHKLLFQKAHDLGVHYLLNDEFKSSNWSVIKGELDKVLERVDYVYLTIDLDGFSSAYAPGVSAPSPMGFSPEVVQ
ncbi:MAG: formimidoylglutamase, partial [Bacteroidota bacterium]